MVNVEIVNKMIKNKAIRGVSP